MDQAKDVEAQTDTPGSTEPGATDSEETRQSDTSAREGLETVAEEAQAAAAGQLEEVREMAAEDTVRATQEYIAATEETSMAPEYRGFSFRDGFRFGCGFTIAGCLVWLILSIILVAIPVVLSALNVIGLPGS